MHKQEPYSDENNKNDQENNTVDGLAGDLDFSFHGTSLWPCSGIKKVHAKNSRALQNTGALPPPGNTSLQALILSVVQILSRI